MEHLIREFEKEFKGTRPQDVSAEQWEQLKPTLRLFYLLGAVEQEKRNQRRKPDAIVEAMMETKEAKLNYSDERKNGI